MKLAKLDEMIKGWFVGNFDPTLIRTGDVEVAVKRYEKGDYEERHYHKLATEITVVVSGRVRMNGIVYQEGDIIIVEPFEATDFEALEDAVNTVVKYPGAKNDKYIGEPVRD
jgi:quercetin dioxygenase-like cupin family protein